MINEENKKKVKKIASEILYILVAPILLTKTMGSIQSLTNHRAVGEYKEIVSDFADFLEENGYDNPKEIFDCYSYALWNGYLSNNHQLNYSLDRKIYIKNSGIGCVLGESVCLNNANMLKDIYDEAGYKSYTVNCYVNPKTIGIVPIGSSINIERNIKENTNTKKMEVLNNLLIPLQQIAGNHCITCVEYENQFYYYDPTNLAYLGKSNSHDLDILNGTGKFTIRYYTSLMCEGLTLIETIPSTNEKTYYEEIMNIEPTIISEEALNSFYSMEAEKYSQIDTYSNNILGNVWVSSLATLAMYGVGTNALRKKAEKSLSRKRKS